jgi:AraC-like DNA-binding protein
MQIVVREITDPDEAAAALYPTKAEIMPVGSGQFARYFVSIDFPSLRLRSFLESLPRLVHVNRAPDRAHVGFLLDETSNPIVVDGLEIDTGAFVQFGSGCESTHRSFSPIAWANLSVSHAELARLSSGLGGHDLAAGRTPRLLMPDPTKMRRLRTLHASVITVAKQSPELLSEPGLVCSMEAALMEAMVDCLGSPDQQRHSPAQLRHAAVLGRFRELLDANLDRPLYLPEVCAAIGVSHRALSYSCQDFLGMPPKRYFFLRRMHMVRRVLLESDRRATTVTEVATRHGFWEFGRFAVQYKMLFDEMPSATLRRDKCSSCV